MKIFLFLILYFYCVTVFPQKITAADRLADFVENIDNFNSLYPQEKVYLHFDNTGYHLGETVWFKAYAVSATPLTYSDYSKVLYVELLTPEGKIKETQKLKIENGQAQGYFNLADIYFPGFYEIRAYTRYMLNFDEEVIFSRVFPVYNELPRMEKTAETPQISKQFNLKNINLTSLRKKEKAKDLTLTFYPEGGNLVTGITNHVAFKATDKEGKGVNISGAIYDSRSREVASFSGRHLGMGSFAFVPDREKYIAKVNCENREYKFDLPKSLSYGYTLHVANRHPDTISVHVEKTAGMPAQMLGVTFTVRGKVSAFKSFEINSSGKYTISLPKEELPAGVVQITLFTPQGEVLAQRRAFNGNNIQTLHVRTTGIRTDFTPFSPISIDLEVKDKDNRSVETTFSLSVRERETQAGANCIDNIQYNLLLSSDLKGYIEDPAYYFEAEDPERLINLDLLMQVQGWVRYSWKQAAGTEPFEIKHGMEKGLTLEGSVLSSGRKKPEKGSEVIMWMTSKREGKALTGNCITDDEGKYKFDLAEITGTYNLNLIAKKKNRKGEFKFYKTRITIDRHFSPEPAAFDYYQTYLSGERSIDKPLPFPGEPVEKDEQAGDITSPQNPSEDNREKPDNQLEQQRQVVLPEVEVITSDLRISGKGSVAFYDIGRELDRYRDMGKSEPNNVLDFLTAVNPDFSWNRVMLKGPRQGEYGIETHYCGRKTPVFVNVPEWQTAGTVQQRELEYLNIDRVEFIAIRQDRERFVISVATRDYMEKYSRQNDNGKRATFYDGFARRVEFYSPDYSAGYLPESDLRRTLYWDPDVKTNVEGKAVVNFFNNGTCIGLDISAEGLDKDGTPVVLFKDGSK